VSENAGSENPTEAEFLAAPVAAVAALAPKTIVYAPGGTRRSATISGVEPWSEAYMYAGQDGITACLDVIFRYGVEHVFTPMIMFGHANEVDDIEQELIIPMGRFVTHERLLGLFREYGWRVRIAPSAYQETLQPFIEILERETAQDAKHTWWMTFTPTFDSWWLNMIALAKAENIVSRSDLVLAVYGEEISPITLCLSFGKPTISPDLFPPLLMDNVQCYWSQQAGLSLDDRQFRKVLYDYAYLRPTWQRDKTTRAKAAIDHQEIWQREAILGLGTRLGPFWYPIFPGTSPT
jgi:hypothetical protein